MSAVEKRRREESGSESGFERESGSNSSEHSESGSEGSSGSDSSSDSSSARPVRPKFVRKRPAPKVAAPEQTERVNWNLQIENKPVLVDDTDGPDAAEQYAAWRQREQARLQRELDALEAAQLAYEEMQDRLERNALDLIPNGS